MDNNHVRLKIFNPFGCKGYNIGEEFYVSYMSGNKFLQVSFGRVISKIESGNSGHFYETAISREDFDRLSKEGHLENFVGENVEIIEKGRDNK